MGIVPHSGQDMQGNQDQGDDGNEHHPAQEEAHHEIEDELDFEIMPREEACEAAHEEGSKTVTILKYYAYCLFQHCEEFSSILYAGRLYQQLVVDAYAVVEQAHLEWLKFNQMSCRQNSTVVLLTLFSMKMLLPNCVTLMQLNLCNKMQ